MLECDEQVRIDHDDFCESGQKFHYVQSPSKEVLRPFGTMLFSPSLHKSKASLSPSSTPDFGSKQHSGDGLDLDAQPAHPQHVGPSHSHLMGGHTPDYPQLPPMRSVMQAYPQVPQSEQLESSFASRHHIPHDSGAWQTRRAPYEAPRMMSFEEFANSVLSPRRQQ
jgi:hypothetical protein